MEEDNRTCKELIMAILQKCKQALPELALLTQRIDRMNSSPPAKVKRRDCLNPTFLIKLSECGQNIRLIFQQALSVQFPNRDTLKRYYNEYMQVIYDIRKYHEESHKTHDMHKNSTMMKTNLLEELKAEISRREQAQGRVRLLVVEHEREIYERDLRIGQLEKDDINISRISSITRKEQGDRGVYGSGGVYGSRNRRERGGARQSEESGGIYGSEDKGGEGARGISRRSSGMDEEQEYQGTVEARMARSRILELEQELAVRERQHQQELLYQKQGILELQHKFEQLMGGGSNITSQSLKLSTFHNSGPISIPVQHNPLAPSNRASSPVHHRGSSPVHHRGSSPVHHRGSSPVHLRSSSPSNDRARHHVQDFYRYMVIQATTIEQFLNQQADQAD